MRSYQDLKWILVLCEQGHTKKAISRLTGFPRSTIRDAIDKYGSQAALEPV